MSLFFDAGVAQLVVSDQMCVYFQVQDQDLATTSRTVWFEL